MNFNGPNVGFTPKMNGVGHVTQVWEKEEKDLLVEDSTEPRSNAQEQKTPSTEEK